MEPSEKELVHSKAEEPKKLYKRLLIGAPVLLDILFSGIYLSMLAPFFPQLALSKGINTGKQSFVFTAPEIIGILSAFLWGKVVPYIGVKNVWLLGVFSASVLVCLFGLLEYSPGGNTFLAFALVIRCVEGLSAYAIVVTGSTILIGLFPEKAGTMLTLSDSLFAVGFGVGPVLGSLLYDAVGFFFTFLINGIIICLFGLLGLALIPHSSSKDDNEKKIDYLRYLRCINVWISIILIVNGGFAALFFQNIFSIHLRKFGVSMTEIGATFSGAAIAFAITNILWSYIGTTKLYLLPFINVIGLNLNAIIFLFIGPAQFIQLPKTSNELARIIACFVLSAVTVSTFTVNYSQLTNSLSETGLELNIASKSMVSAIAAGCFSTGIILSEIPSGYIYQLCGFRCASSVIFWIQFALAVVITIYYLIQYVREKSTKQRLFPPETIKSLHGYEKLDGNTSDKIGKKIDKSDKINQELEPFNVTLLKK